MATSTHENGSTKHTPSTSRRKSLCIQHTQCFELLENNDESERLNIRKEQSAPTTDSSTVSDRRKSLGLGFLSKVSTPEMQERVSECMKLNAENKINVKNAFCFKMIDFMTYMVKKNDANMCNLQVASVSLDVSTTIYSYRVDGIHADIVKMAGGVDKKIDENVVNDVSAEDETSESQQNEKKKKKKRNKQKVFGTVNSLKGTVDTYKPALHMMDNKDTQTSDNLYQAMLPNHVNTKYCLHFCNDVILDTLGGESGRTESGTTEVAIPKIENFSELEICPSLADFEFLENPDYSEIEKDNDTQSNKDNRDRFTFDLDASLAPDVCDDVCHVSPENDSEHTVEAHVEEQRAMTEIEDLREVITSNIRTTPSEYSFIPINLNLHWAGPSHWKVRDLMRIRDSRIEGACQQERVRKRKEIELCFDDTVIIETVAPKFTQSKAVALNTALLKWEEEDLMLPQDMYYDITSITKLYIHELITTRPRVEKDSNATPVPVNYDYNNENDASYCPNVSNEDYEGNEEADNESEHDDGGDDANTPELLAFTGENLVTVPKLTNKIAIAYSTRAKKLDMRQLKTAICKLLDDDDNNKENVNTENTADQENDNGTWQNKSFREVYKLLPKKLTTKNAEALSFPIGFVSLLHVANERNIEIESVEGMSDLIIKKKIK